MTSFSAGGYGRPRGSVWEWISVMMHVGWDQDIGDDRKMVRPDLGTDFAGQGNDAIAGQDVVDARLDGDEKGLVPK